MNYRIVMRKIMLAATALVIVIGFQNCGQEVNFKTANNTSTFNNDYYEAVFKTSNITQKQTSVTVGSSGIQVPLTLDAVTNNRSENFEQVNQPNHTNIYKQGHKPSMHSETFTQIANNGLLDILIVVDDSGSMSDEQQNLSQRMDPLLSAIKDTDWRIAVITTHPNESCVRNVINKQDPNRENDFKNAIQVGASGGIENGVSNILIGLGCSNPKWVRANSSLAILLVTDEDDDSRGTQASLFNELTSMGREVGKDARVYGLLNLSQMGHYDDIIKASKGIYGSVASSDYTNILTQISQDVATILKNQFELAAKPNMESLNITVNGNPWNGNYTVNDRTLTFTDTLPPEGSTIQVNYSSGGAPINTAFTLSKTPLESSLAVTINNQAVPMEQMSYDKVNNKIVFSSAPPENSDIVVKYKENIPLIEAFKLGTAQVIPESIKVMMNGNSLSNFMYQNQTGTLSFTAPIPEGMSFSVTYKEFVSPKLDYTPSLSGDGIDVISVVDTENGSSVAHQYIGGVIKIDPSEFLYNRKLMVRYSNNDLKTAQITLDRYAVMESVRLSGGSSSCSLLNQPVRLFCDTDKPLNIMVSYITEEPVTEFSLLLNPFLSPEQGTWMVMDKNENPISGFTRSGNTIRFDHQLNVSDVVIRFIPDEKLLASN